MSTGGSSSSPAAERHLGTPALGSEAAKFVNHWWTSRNRFALSWETRQGEEQAVNTDPDT